MSINDWNNLALHDLPFDKMHFDFENRSCALYFSEVDEETEAYIPYIFRFSGIYKFTSEYPEHLNFEPVGCCSARFTEEEDGRFSVDFIMELDTDPVWFLSLGFTSLEIEGGLSEEARADRVAYFEEQAGEIE